MLCTSGFIDDVTFGHNGRNAKTIGSTTADEWHGDTGTASEGAGIPGQSLMSMNAELKK